VLSGSGRVVVHDPLVQRWEMAVFGMQVSAEWWQRMPSRFWSTVLHAAYFAYYVIVVTPAFYFALRRDLASLRHFILVLMTTFVLCYLVFIFFPSPVPTTSFPAPPPGSPTTSSPGWSMRPWPRAARTARHSPAPTSPRRSPPPSRRRRAAGGSVSRW
jgi:hypothetical protein